MKTASEERPRFRFSSPFKFNLSRFPLPPFKLASRVPTLSPRVASAGSIRGWGLIPWTESGADDDHPSTSISTGPRHSPTWTALGDWNGPLEKSLISSLTPSAIPTPKGQTRPTTRPPSHTQQTRPSLPAPLPSGSPPTPPSPYSNSAIGLKPPGGGPPGGGAPPPNPPPGLPTPPVSYNVAPGLTFLASVAFTPNAIHPNNPSPIVSPSCT